MRDIIAQKLDKARRRLEKLEASRQSALQEVADLETALRVIDSIESAPNDPSRQTRTVGERIIDALNRIGRPSSRPVLAEFLDEDGDPVKDTTMSGTLARLSKDQKIIHHDGAWWLLEWWEAHADSENYRHDTAEEPPTKEPSANLGSNQRDRRYAAALDDDGDIPF